MKKLYPSRLLWVLFWAAALSGFAQEKPDWRIYGQSPQSQFNFDPTTGRATGGVVVSNSMAVLMAETLTVNQETGDVVAEGPVTIIAQGHMWESTNIVFNYANGQVRANNFRTGQNPFFVSGKNLEGSETNNTYSATDVKVTSDDYAEPAYQIRAKQIIIVPNYFFEAYDATVYLGNVPVFYFPHYKRSLQRHPNNFAFKPGYRGSWGPFLLTEYNWYYSEQLSGSVHMDWRQRRGAGAGPDVNYDLGQKLGSGFVKGYYAHDEDPNADQVFGPIPEDRGRVTFVHQAFPTSNTVAKVVARYQSDPQIIRDFFESEYRKNVQPKSFAEVTHVWRNFVLDFEAQPQLVDFFETVERLPDLKLTGLRQQVGATPVYYESESSFGYFRRNFSDLDTNNVQDYSAGRGDTFHQFLVPQTYFGWLNFTPRVGGRVTYYTDTHNAAVSTNEQVRGVFNTGAELSTKASRVWRNAESKTWEVDGLRHIVEPGVNYVFVPDPTRRPPQLPQFDYESPSLRLLPIDFPDYNSIDSIDTRNVLRMGVRNKLQTKRERGIEDVVNWALYTDWRLERGTNFFNQRRQSQFSDVFSDLELRPRSWLTVNSELRYDTETNRFREVYHRVLFQPNSTWSYSISHRYWMNNDPEFFNDVFPGQFDPGFNTITSTLYYRMNENWAARVAHRFEARDGKLEEQYYTLYRDLRSWTSALTLRFRENRAGRKSDFTVAVTFSLKTFPRFGLGTDIARPETLFGE